MILHEQVLDDFSYHERFLSVVLITHWVPQTDATKNHGENLSQNVSTKTKYPNNQASILKTL